MHKAIGNKAVSIDDLRSSGFNIPLFLSLDSNTSFDDVQTVVNDKFKPGAILAIRSSSVLEDGKEKSFAGAFH